MHTEEDRKQFEKVREHIRNGAPQVHIAQALVGMVKEGRRYTEVYHYLDDNIWDEGEIPYACWYHLDGDEFKSTLGETWEDGIEDAFSMVHVRWVEIPSEWGWW